MKSSKKNKIIGFYLLSGLCLYVYFWMDTSDSFLLFLEQLKRSKLYANAVEMLFICGLIKYASLTIGVLTPIILSTFIIVKGLKK